MSISSSRYLVLRFVTVPITCIRNLSSHLLKIFMKTHRVYTIYIYNILYRSVKQAAYNADQLMNAYI